MKTTFTVLIIDDEIEICYLVAKTLRSKGIESFYAYTISEAKDILQTFTPSLIFLDNNLPDGLGIDFIEYIKLHFPITKVSIITGDESNRDMSLALSKGAIDYISKPFTKDKIISVVEKACCQ